MLVHVSRLQHNVVETAALHHAKLYIRALTEFRTLYTAEVVSVASQHGLEVTHDYQNKPGAIPIPATLTMLLGDRIGASGLGASSRLYSPYPFPWRSKEWSGSDGFQQEAWKALSVNPSRAFYRYERRDKNELFRYAVADLMREDCVACHNSHPQSPKTDWQVNDVRGVLEVMFPLDPIIKAANDDLKSTIYAYIFLAVCLVLGIALIVIKQWRHSNELERKVEARTAELSTEVELRKQYEDGLIKAREAADRASKAKSEFLSYMNHEIRSPLNSIIGFSQLLEVEDGLNESQRESVGLILSAGRHLVELIDDLLDLSKIEVGQLDLKMEQVEVTLLLYECWHLFPMAKDQYDVTLEEIDPEQQGVKVWSDYRRLKQVLLNLVSNAIKYNRRGGSVSVSFIEISGDYLRIEVTDAGEGLDDESIQRLFQPFERLGAKESGIEGTGMGLVVSKQLIGVLGGAIGVESQPGVGSTFWVEVPRTKEAYLKAAEED